MNELKNCPFCGNKAEVETIVENDGYCHYNAARVVCTKCGCRTQNYIIDGYYGATTTIQDAINDWNNRV